MSSKAAAPVTPSTNNRDMEMPNQAKPSKGGWKSAIFIICSHPTHTYLLTYLHAYAWIHICIISSFWSCCCCCCCCFERMNKSFVWCLWNAVVEMAERFAYYGVSGNLIMYLTRVLGQTTSTAAKNVNVWRGVSAIFPLFGAFVADSYLGRFKTILLSSIIYLLVSSPSFLLTFF